MRGKSDQLTFRSFVFDSPGYFIDPDVPENIYYSDLDNDGNHQAFKERNIKKENFKERKGLFFPYATNSVSYCRKNIYYMTDLI